MALVLFFVSARTNKRHHHHHQQFDLHPGSAEDAVGYCRSFALHPFPEQEGGSGVSCR